ncbi:peptidase S12 family protein [Gordonia rhizosphera NBRC 16068]|uniref:Peptidase S12 family protein n=1 Tax=Gordonia rhizosphera NBRC 16068 TaxID=1108045 RepID=K6WEE7_9ACTN|nr:peptidase S12 family protein [Gordonia rhizosphera NBRC 16068]
MLGAVAAFGLIVSACSDSGDESSSADISASSSPSSAAAAGTVKPLDQAALQAALDEGAQEFLLPGAVALLRTPSGTVTATYGTTERDGGTPVSLDDHVRIGSNTKTWTATVTLQLAQEGKLAVTDPVSKYRAGVPNGDNITIEQLLNMRSGLYNYSETPQVNEALDNDPQRVWTPDELLAIAFENQPYFPPGEGYHYSNTNYVLLGLIAEKLDDKPLAEVYQDRIFKPAGLTSTVFPELPDTSLPDPYSHGYFYGTNMLTINDPALPEDMQAAAKNGSLAPADVTNNNPSWTWAAGGGISTANDLATWAEALADGKMLDQQMQQQRMASIQSSDPSNPSAAGYGWGLAKMGPMYGHTGELPGYNSFMGSDPENKVTLVVWANLAPGVNGQDPATTIARGIIEKMYAG